MHSTIKTSSGRVSRLASLGWGLVVLSAVLESLRAVDLSALGAPPWVSALLTVVGVTVVGLRRVTHEAMSGMPVPPPTTVVLPPIERPEGDV